MPTQDSERIVRFSAFELDLQAGELRRSGVRLPVQGRPLQVLTILLRTPGQLVTGEQMRGELWPADTFVDFEHGVRNAVARLRAVLGDNAERPRFVETLPRRGYRFIGAVAAVAAAAQPVPVTQAVQPAPPGNRWRIALVAFLCLGALAGAATWIYDRFRGNPAGVQIESLAVLPLENLSGDPAQDYFADGITDELITTLAKIDSVKVISRTSLMQYKGVHTKPLPQIARELGVDAVVEGTLSRTGDRVRVTAQLIEASTDRHIWADRYDRSARDIRLLENEIARAIAEQLRGKLNPQEQRRLSGNPIDPAAHEAYLQGRYLWNRRTPPALKEAIRYFTQAIEKEPRYAEAYAGRAQAYIVLGSGGMEAIPPQEALSKARPDAEKAVQLDGTSSEAHSARAAIRFITNGIGVARRQNLGAPSS
ncbi:MAG: winged helix-turn-helix domain-containing protein [Bryobacteraceae bacterium]